MVDRLLLGLLTFFKGTNAWLEHVRPRSVIWKSERGVGPTKGIENATRDTLILKIDMNSRTKIWKDLDVTGDGVGDQLNGSDQKATGEQKAHRDLVVEPEHKCIRRIRFHLKTCWLTISQIRVYLPWRHSSAPQTRSLGTSSCCRLLVLQTRSQNHLKGDEMTEK